MEGLDISQLELKVDHFDQVHVLGPDNVIDGAPNFRQVSGFPIFGCAQPTETGVKEVFEKVSKGSDEKAVKTIWYNMRQEPVLYCNGDPYAPRHSERMHENLSIDGPVSQMDELENSFYKIVKERIENDPEKKLKINKDSGFTENPTERENVAETVLVDALQPFSEIISELKRKGAKNLDLIRVPAIEEKAPREDCFDILVDSLKTEPASTVCVFSCQAGRGRTSLGMVIACQVKEILICTELRRMAEIGLVPAATAEDLIKQKFEFPLPKGQDDDDPFVKGEFDVIKELLDKLPGAKEGKAKIDRLIDLCGPGPKGTGLQNLRQCIIETKWKYDVAPEDRQVAFRQLILNFMERYFYLICFATYAKEYGPAGFQKSFVTWMDDHCELRKMIELGKDKLEWYRQVDPAKLNTLKDLMNSPNYKDNMPSIIRTIYEFAFITYADLPRGPIKNNSMRKLAAKTLLEILPTEVSTKVQERLEEQGANPDFVILIGLVSFYGQGQ